jgi:hypothetical protein
MNPYEIDRTQVEHEARAKIFWGDPPDKVFTYLLGQAVLPEEAQLLVDSMISERMRAIRGVGARKILAGAALMLVPVVVYGIMASANFFSVRFFGMAVAVGLWGAWKVMKGCFLFFAPQSESGDVADL